MKLKIRITPLRAIISVTLVTLVGLYVLQPGPAPIDPSATAVAIRAFSLHKQMVQPVIDLLGEVISNEDAKLAANNQATVVNTPVRPGDTVKQGDLLVAVDPRDAQHQLNHATAVVQERTAALNTLHNQFASNQLALKHQQSLLQLSQKQVKRYQKLAGSDYVAQQDVDKAIADAHQQSLAINTLQLAIDNYAQQQQQAKALLAQAISAKQQAQLNLSRTHIRAPFDGQVSAMHTAIGERVDPRKILVEMYNPNTLEVRAQVPQRWQGALPKNLKNSHTKAQISNDATVHYHNHQLAARLIRVRSVIDSGKAAQDVYFALKDTAHTLPLGATVKVRMKLPATHAFSIPVTCLHQHHSVFQVVNNRLVRRTVTVIGRTISAGKAYVIVDGDTLKEKDLLLSSPMPHAINGLLVAVIP